MDPTWESLAPILQAHWQGDEAALRALAAHAASIDATTDAVGRGWRIDAREHDIFGAVYLSLAERVLARKGLKADTLAGRAPAWFRTVIARETLKHLRRILGVRRREGPTPEGWEPADEAEPPAFLGSVERAIEHARARDVKPPQLLAFVARYAPRLVSAALVTAAGAYRSGTGSAHGAAGLCRNAQETWRLLAPWIDAHADDPDTPEARLALAWVLRSDDTVSPDAWRRRAHGEAETAQGTLRKWVSRAAERLRTEA